MRFRGVLAAVCGVVALGIPASAMAGYGYCETYAPHQAARVTPVFEFPAGAGGDGISSDFETYMEAKLGFNLMPMCNSYGDDEARANKMQAYALAQTKQDMPAVLDQGFETYVAQKYGGARKSKAAPTAGADGAGQNDTSEAKTPANPSAAQLSAERHKAVEERNRAAQAQYEADLAEQQRKVAEFNRLTEEMERKKAEQQAAAQRALEGFKADQATHAEQMRRHQQEVSDYQAKLAGQQSPAPPAGRGDGKFQATSAIVATREQAMAGLLAQPLPTPLTDIQCAEVKMYTPPKWTCWGFYKGERKAAGASAQ
jgi:hypothetical protein